MTIGCPHAVRARATAKHPGAAAQDAERRKHVRETYGRLGPKSQHALATQAREAALFGTVFVPAGHLLRRWRADLDLALAFCQAEAVLLSRGGQRHVAGPARFPMGRIMRNRTAAAGERPETLPCLVPDNAVY